MMRTVLLLALLMPPAAAAQTSTVTPRSRTDIITAARDVMAKARFCTFVTNGLDGHPAARIVDPIAPDADFVIWFATNPLTRKVKEVGRDARVTLLCFEAATLSYVTVQGRGALIADAAVKQAHWKDDWSRVYPNGARSSDVVLIRVAPIRLEIVSESRGLFADPKTWLPLAIEFRGQGAAK
jgi:general stress protein 26